jgi:hypothetical protein
VETFDGVEEKGMRSRAGQRCHDFFTDKPRFADPGNNYATFATADQFDRTGKFLSNAVNESKDAFRFELKHFLRLFDGLVFIHDGTSLPIQTANIF